MTKKTPELRGEAKKPGGNTIQPVSKAGREVLSNNNPVLSF